MRGGADRLRQLRRPGRDELRRQRRSRRAPRRRAPSARRSSRGAYSLPTGGVRRAPTIGIVDAYDDPNIESDLAALRQHYGLPACTTANGCFRKVNQTGGTSYPATNSGWALEIALDVETAHEICQTCKILLVEASSNSFANLGAAENEAVALGANVISNSWGGGESSGETVARHVVLQPPRRRDHRVDR